MKVGCSFGRWFGFYLAVLLAGLACERVRAANPLAGCDLRRPIWGQPVDAGQLAGKVIFFEYWGIWCPPCRASLPHLVTLQDQYGPTGKFQVIASHYGNQSSAVKFCRENKINFPVYQDLVPRTAPRPRSWPRAYLFDHTGRLVAEGHPMQLKSQVKALVEAAPDPAESSGRLMPPVLGNAKVQYCKDQAGQLVIGRPLAPGLKALQRIADSKQGQAADEARRLVQSVEQWVRQRIEQVGQLQQDRPTVALELCNQLMPMLSGLPQQKQVFQLRQPLAGNKDVLALMRYRKQVERGVRSLNEGQRVSMVRRELQAVARRIEAMLGYPDLPDNLRREAGQLLEQIKQQVGSGEQEAGR